MKRTPFYGRALALTLETLAKYPYPAHPSTAVRTTAVTTYSATRRKECPSEVGNDRLLSWVGWVFLTVSQAVCLRTGRFLRRRQASSQRWRQLAKSVGLDRGEGSSQFDYIKRICNSIDRNDPPCAIALLGTDIFDKLSLLSILHEKLPDALYLSTQLDSRYLAPENLAFTRNLIVASPFGLSPSMKKAVNQRDPSVFGILTKRRYTRPCKAPCWARKLAQNGPDLYEIGNSSRRPDAGHQLRAKRLRNSP